jgi:hypothetical protein
MIVVTEVPFVLALVHIVARIRFRPQTPRGAKLMSLHEDMPRKMNIMFIN